MLCDVSEVGDVGALNDVSDLGSGWHVQLLRNYCRCFRPRFFAVRFC